MTFIRRLAIFGVTVIIMLAAASPAIAATRATPNCGQDCTRPAASASATNAVPAHSAPTAPCVHDPSCAGGGSLTLSLTTLWFATSGVIGVALTVLLVRRYRRPRPLEPTGSLIASRLFHPPRLALGH